MDKDNSILEYFVGTMTKQSKQDEIREQIAKIAANNPKPKEVDYETADIVLAYLHSQGLVLKVDRELPLPTWEDVKETALGVDTDTWANMIAMTGVILERMKKARFEAVEDLV